MSRTLSPNHDHHDMLEKYYQELVQCMHEAAEQCIPVYKPGVQKHWWTPELDELKQQCIDATDIWKQLGRPRSGDVNSNRIRCKMRYKNAIKEAHPQQIAYLMTLFMITYATKIILVSGKLGAKGLACKI